MRTPPTPPQFPTGWDFARLQSLMMRCLANLARQGWVVPPNEIEDVTQEFVTRLFEQDLARYDSHRASFSTYVYSEFAWFVRRWVVEYHRWRQKRRELDWLNSPIEAATASEIAESVELQRKALDAIERLPDLIAQVLRGYLESEGSSERELAEQFGMTRHRVRQCLQDAGGMFLANFGQLDCFSDQQARVIEQLWGKRRTVQEAAQYLDLSDEQIEQIARQVIANFGRQLRRTRTTAGRKEK